MIMKQGIIKTLVAIRDIEYATVKQVAIETRQSVRTVQRHVNTLSNEGLIKPINKSSSLGFQWVVSDLVKQQSNKQS